MADSKDIRILIVDNDPDVCENMKQILALDGYEVELANSVAAARLIEDWSDYLAIIVDRRLSDGASDELIPEIKSKAPDTALIVITGCANLHASLKTWRHRVEDYLLKPLDVDTLRASLAQIVKLRRAQRRAAEAERLAIIGQMMAGIVHESRNAMQRIQMAVDLLKLDVSDPELVGEIDKIEQANSDLNTMLDEIRVFAGPINLHRTEVDLSSVWRRAWGNVVSVGDHRDADLIENTNNVDLNCSIDDFRLEQVFRNIFENALAACQSEPSVQIECRDLNGTSIGASNGAIEISICDNGPGFEMAQPHRIFEPFFTTKHTGSGLGMAIVKRTVEAHGGSVAVGNGSHSGAEIVISMPRGS